MKTIPITSAVYQSYRLAAALLAKIMGADAPDAVGLIRHELSRRNPRLIAEDFLDSNRSRRPCRAQKTATRAKPTRRTELLRLTTKHLRCSPAHFVPGRN